MERVVLWIQAYKEGRGPFELRKHELGITGICKGLLVSVLKPKLCR